MTARKANPPGNYRIPVASLSRPTSVGQVRAAQLVCAAHATGPADLRLLLDMLGIGR